MSNKIVVPRQSKAPSGKSAVNDQILHEFDFAHVEMGMFTYRRIVNGQEESAWGGNFSMQMEMLNQLDGRSFDPLEADFAELPVAVQIADRFAPRTAKGRRDVAGVRWARHIKVRLPVRCLERWEQRRVISPLQEYLFRNTGDNWELEFVTHEESQSVEPDEQLENLEYGRYWKDGTPKDLAVVLFSGGVDSTGGIAHQSREHPSRHFVLVSVDTGNVVNARQRDIIKAMPLHVRNRLIHVRFGYDVYEAKKLSANNGDRSNAKTLRTRGLMFLSAAALVARRAGQQRFYVYENGIGALNLSFDRSQIPGQANRVVNPLSLALFSEFFTALFRERLVVENPFLFQTKAALCKALDTEAWRKVIPLTFTCGHPQRVKNGGLWHCGVCTSCILRRQGFRAANMHSEDKAHYLNTPGVNELGQLSSKSEEWLKVGTQFRNIKKALRGKTAVQVGEIWGALCAEYPELRDIERRDDISFEGYPLRPIQLQVKIAKLLSTYVNEGLSLTPTTLQNVEGGEAKEREGSEAAPRKVA